MSKEEFYYLRRLDNSLFFSGFTRDKSNNDLTSTWTVKDDSKPYKEIEALRLQRVLNKEHNIETRLVE